MTKHDISPKFVNSSSFLNIDSIEFPGNKRNDAEDVKRLESLTISEMTLFPMTFLFENFKDFLNNSPDFIGFNNFFGIHS